MNDADREELAAHIADIGCIPETALDDSDIAVLITCTVRANAEQKVLESSANSSPGNARGRGARSR